MKFKHIKIQQVARIADPDLVVCVNGAYVELELKATEADAFDKKHRAKTRLQVHELSKANKGKGYGLLVYPENWGEVRLFLRRINKAYREQLEIPECLKLPTIR